VDVLAEGERDEGFARVAARLFQLFHDVGEGEGAQLFFQVARVLHQLHAGAQQARHRHAQSLGQLFQNTVALGVHAGVVERVLGLGDAQEARGLLEHLGREARHLQQRLRERKMPFLPR
jgi:hypothetical protein